MEDSNDVRRRVETASDLIIVATLQGINLTDSEARAIVKWHTGPGDDELYSVGSQLYRNDGCWTDSDDPPGSDAEFDEPTTVADEIRTLKKEYEEDLQESKEYIESCRAAGKQEMADEEIPMLRYYEGMFKLFKEALERNHL